MRAPPHDRPGHLVNTSHRPPSVARQRELVGLVTELGPTFAERAAGYDREARFPFENYADLREAGLLGLCIPPGHGGLGAHFATYGLVSEELGRYCGSTALTFNMHTATMLLCGQIADDLTMPAAERARHERRRAAMFAGVIEEGPHPRPTVQRGERTRSHCGREHAGGARRRGLAAERSQDLRLAVRRRRPPQRDLRGTGQPDDPVHKRARRCRRPAYRGGLGPTGYARHRVAHPRAGRCLRAGRRRVAAPWRLRSGGVPLAALLPDAVVQLPGHHARRDGLHRRLPGRSRRSGSTTGQSPRSRPVGRRCSWRTSGHTPWHGGC